MKTRLLFISLLLGVNVAAREVVVLGAPEAAGASPSSSPWAVVAGGTLTLDVLIPAAIDRSKIEVGLWQISGSVTLPLGKESAMEAGVVAHGITPVRVEFPKVERATRVLVKFMTKDESRTVLGQVNVWVHPPRDWAPLARKLKKEERRLVVFGQDGALREFLKAREIEFTDNGVNAPERLERDTLAVGALAAKEWKDAKDRISGEGGRLLVFVADSPALPGVYTQVSGESATTQVTMPVPAKLSPDPRNEELFYQLIEQQLHAAPAAIF